MRTSYSKLTVIVAFVAVGTTACSSGPTAPSAPKLHVAAPIESEAGITSAPIDTKTQSGFGTMVLRSGYIISTGNRGGNQTVAPAENTFDDRDIDRR